ncbi:MAG: SpoIIE family protein phosphatase [Candidatus Eremiobacteraeota bacterium]|nr:SpoIIE family protein phosphatase [Candidatus Eremiobacteraeota bacterium]
MPRRPSGIGTGGAIVLATLILLVLIVAIVAGFVAVRQLSAAAAESRLLFAIQERTDALVRVQLDEETSLRGYLIARQREFLEPYLSGVIDPFEEQYAIAARSLSGTDLAPALRYLARIRDWHRQWRSQVAEPLIAAPTPRNVRDRESYGKILTDRLRNEAAALRAYVSGKNDAVQAMLAENIDHTVEYAIGFVLIFALAGFYLTIEHVTTSAALERQHSIAASLQAALGVGWQTIPGSSIGTAYISATREAEVGGDLFDAWRLDDACGAIVIADMSGKGIDAVVNTAFCKYSIRALLETHADPAAVMTEFNRLFARTVSDPAMFAVAFLGVVDLNQRKLRYVSAGHEPAFFRRDATVKALEIGGPIVGLEADSAYRTAVEPMEPGDVILLATDGLTEARDGSGEMLGVAAAMELIARVPTAPQLLCDAVVEAVRERSGGTISDDLALLALRFEGGSAPEPDETV